MENTTVMHHSTDQLEEEKYVDVSSVSSEMALDEALEKTVWRKLDVWILPVVAMFYLLSFLVRTSPPPHP